ncbi:glycosyltransferase family 2 protein [Bradyrhizobium sp. IC3195]|uniref:glycosyltransferase family 2 protein n=1 Tax=Bradyrhizobium sp. IC3195 TaxID=2793804 RepID=UPI001CD2F166|nr:glycosyltransferase family 2 protein [Bradyrhizobium sp. IC3195]MCA1467131.1 glycosyltransferase family 2 protein [Bradyrhizobium sp. IC3195]
MSEPIADVAVIIVGFRNCEDVRDCLWALSNSSPDPSFDIFICENGGTPSFVRLLNALLGEGGPCEESNEREFVAPECERCVEVRGLRLRGRSASVWVACAAENFGYAGGVNAWLKQLQKLPSWKGVWILNPDTQPEANALAELAQRARAGNKGMVGSTILDVNQPDKISCRGGIHWQKWATRSVMIGFGEPASAACDLRAIEAAMDCPSGASMYVTRECIEKIGPMDESYFLFSEDLDWGVRAKRYGLGYASASIVTHKRGTTTGSAMSPLHVPRFSVYLQHRNAVRFVRKHFPLTLPICVVVMFLYAVRYLLRQAPRQAIAAFHGTIAGLKGETGPPIRYSEFRS